MNHILFKFSSLLSAGYSSEKHVLEIMFTDGTKLRYADVPSTIYFSLINAYSHDSYFEKYIKSIYNLIK